MLMLKLRKREELLEVSKGDKNMSEKVYTIEEIQKNSKISL